MQARARNKVFSLCWDWVTGDCRDGEEGPCARGCSGCEGTPLSRPKSAAYDISAKESRRRIAVLRKRFLYTSGFQVHRAIVRDCHAEIVQFLHEYDEVFDLDSHFDTDIIQYDEYGLCCATWIDAARLRGVNIEEISHPSEAPLGDYTLFIAVSRPYTISRNDGDLFRLLFDLPCGVDFDGRS